MIAVANLSARTDPSRAGPDGAFELTDLSFTVEKGAYGVVIGPAGAGKTTLLEAISGLIPVTLGSVTLDGVDVTHLAPEERHIGLIYQHAYLFPHMTVAENIAYGASDPAIAADLTRRFGVVELRDRNVETLSGGERQLVALARGLARRPSVVLLDEPFAALDERSRHVARRTVRALHRAWGFTVLHVTHDFAEAGMLGDIMMLLHRGRLLQSGAPEVVFRQPSTPFVAGFVGAENVFAGELRAIPERTSGVAEHGADGDGWIDNRSAAFTIGELTLFVAGDFVEDATHAVIRAEEIAISRVPSASSIRNQFPGMVTDLTPSGALTRVSLDVHGIPMVASVSTRSCEEMQLKLGDDVIAAFKTTAVHLC